METMMADQAHERGGPEVLRYEEAPRPFAGNGEVLVEVHAAAVTRVSCRGTPAGAARTTRLGRR